MIAGRVATDSDTAPITLFAICNARLEVLAVFQFFDDNGRPKPAYKAVMDALHSGSGTADPGR